jgi:pyruvate kinase
VDDCGAKLIVVWSQHGGGARYLSKHNFNIPIVAISSDERITRQMQLLRGVVPVRMDPPNGSAAFTEAIDRYLQDVGWAHAGDRCVLVAGHPIGQSGVTNSLALHTIGQSSSGAFFQPG